MRSEELHTIDVDEWTLTLSNEYVEATTFGSMNKEYLVSRTVTGPEVIGVKTATQIADWVKISDLAPGVREAWYDYLRGKIYDLMEEGNG